MVYWSFECFIVEFELRQLKKHAPVSKFGVFMPNYVRVYTNQRDTGTREKII